MPDRWNNPADENNPLRTEERERVRDELEARLTANGVKLTGSETDEQIVALSNAFELFDSARERSSRPGRTTRATSFRSGATTSQPSSTLSACTPRRVGWPTTASAGELGIGVWGIGVSHHFAQMGSDSK